MNILILAGEASGDHHGAQVVSALKAKHPDAKIQAIGGTYMQRAGAEIIFDCAKIAVVGFIEVLKHYSDIKAAWQAAKTALAQKPDLVVLIDYPGFNLRFAKLCKEQNTPVLYYISPQIWAWKAKRIHKIKQYIDHMAVIFPFETQIYQSAGVPVTYVGNPVADSVHPLPSKDAAKLNLGLDNKTRYIGLVPGSRMSEIDRILPTLQDTAAKLHAQDPNLEFIIPIASTLDREVIASRIRGSNLLFHLIQHQNHVAIQACDLIVCSSGTVTLETALLGTPMIIIYRVNPLTFWFAKRLVKVDHIGLCNIVAGKRIVPELLQDQANPEHIISVAEDILHNKARYQEIIDGLATVRDKLAVPGIAADNIVHLVEQIIKKK